MSLFKKSGYPVISKQWLKQKYWNEEKTAVEIAEIRKTTETYIKDQIKVFGLGKKKNGIKLKGKKGYVMPEHEKEKHRIQPNAKEVVAYKNSKMIGIFRSICQAAAELKVPRTHIKDCLNPEKSRKSTYGYSFIYKKYRGEIIVERRANLDFSKDLEDITNGLYVKLPCYPREDRINHYNKKINQVFKNLERSVS